MKLIRKNLIPVLSVFFVIALILLIIIKSELDSLQTNVDMAYYQAISDTMDGLGKDYSKLTLDEKVQCYYHTYSNLKDALDLYHFTSYKNENDLYQVLNRLYTYLLQNQNENYEIEDKLEIFEFLGKISAFPQDAQVISDFNAFLDEKSK